MNTQSNDAVSTSAGDDIGDLSQHSAERRERTAEGKPQEISNVINAIFARVNAIMDKANLLVQLQTDALKFSVTNAVVKAGLGLFGFLIAAGLAVIALALVITGISYALGGLMGGRVWLSHLIVGVTVLSAMGLTAWIGLKRLRDGHFKKTRAKYAAQNI